MSSYGHSKQVVIAGTRGGKVDLWAISQPQESVKSFSLPEGAGVPLTIDCHGDTTILAGTSQMMLVQWNMK